MVLIGYQFHTCTRACGVTSVASSWALCTVARWAPLSMGFSRQEYWSGLPRPPPDCMHSSIYMSTLVSQFFPLPLLSLVSIRSVCLCLCVCFADKSICIIFLASTLTILYSVFLFLSDSFPLYDSLCVHPPVCRLRSVVPFCG